MAEKLTRERACDTCGWYAPILARFGDDPEQRCVDCHESHIRYLHRHPSPDDFAEANGK